VACLDTTVLIDLMAKPTSARFRAAATVISELEAEAESVTTTCFNLAELLVGVARADSPDVERRKVARVLEAITVLEFIPSAAELFAVIIADAQRRGKPSGDMDALIAATAMSHGHELVTRNAKHFESIKGLRLRTYRG
jgi:predicted nucleic acid-binding protein